VLVPFITQTFKVLISNHGGHLGLIRPLSFKAVFVFAQNAGIQFFYFGYPVVLHITYISYRMCRINYKIHTGMTHKYPCTFF